MPILNTHKFKKKIEIHYRNIIDKFSSHEITPMDYIKKLPICDFYYISIYT